MSRPEVPSKNTGYYFALARQKFLRLTSREKVLILLVVGVVFYYWFSNHMERQDVVWKNINIANFTGSSQQAEIDEEPSVRAIWETAVAEVPVGELLTREEVEGNLDEMLRRYATGNRFSCLLYTSDAADE